MISALFVDEKGPYFQDQDIDPWGVSRDARLYRGPNCVIAHPPCQLWGNLAFVNFARWGGEHNRPGNDQGCFLSALSSVEAFGGVLEHPKNSRAFEKFGLSRPIFGRWTKTRKGWVTEVWQSAYGHRANKATWLYYVGKHTPFDLCWLKIKGSHQVGFHDQRGPDRNKPTLSKREAAETPRAFKDVLKGLALLSKIT